MNEFVLVEFIAKYPDEAHVLLSKLAALGEDFVDINSGSGGPARQFGTQWMVVSGKINSMRASFIVLQDPFLAERMRISHISDELKNKYKI